MGRAMQFAVYLTIGVLFIFVVGVLAQGTWDIAQWPEKARKTASVCAIFWGLFVVFFSGDD